MVKVGSMAAVVAYYFLNSGDCCNILVEDFYR
jgi:hypothetical protein